MGMYCLVWLQSVEPPKVVYVQDMSIRGLVCFSCILRCFECHAPYPLKLLIMHRDVPKKNLCVIPTMQGSKRRNPESM
jgi:hypothetical protein